MSQPSPDHHHRKDYSSALSALRDAHRVQADLIATIANTDGLFVDPAAIEFLARRAERLVAACIANVEETTPGRTADA